MQSSWAFALLGAGLFLACGKKTETAFERPPAPVVVAQAVSQDVPVYIDAVGKIVCPRSCFDPAASFRADHANPFHRRRRRQSRSTAVYRRSAPVSGPLNQAEANLAQAEAALSLAKINFARVENISDPRAVSRQDYDTKKSAVDSADALVKQNRAAVENAPRLNLEYCTIRSPINGRAGQRAVDVGNVVAANNGSLLVIQRLDPIYADFTVTENDLSGGAAQHGEAQFAAWKCVCRMTTGNAARGQTDFSR